MKCHFANLQSRLLAASAMVLILLAAGPKLAMAQTVHAPINEPELTSWKGVDGTGKTLDSPSLRGKVVLLMFWSTECPVCLEKMRELRHNLEGWKGQPFVAVGLNDDVDRGKWLAYESIVGQTLAGDVAVRSVWLREAQGNLPVPGPQARHRPMAWLISPDGRVVNTYDGRIPPEAWDDIADLVQQAKATPDRK